jgi:capsular polysaccharide transport system ATP-binding protein
VIELRNLSKAYRIKGIRKQVLDRVTLHFPADRNVAIMGPNGSGKSTLMRLLAGAEQPDEGEVIRKVSVSWPLGFSGGFNGSMTGIENIRFIARVYGADSEDVIDRVTDFAELGPSLRLPVKTYSSGMKARLAFGMSMAIDFQCYLIDEVIAVGDETFRRKSQAMFRGKLSQSRIVMVSHSAAQIREYCQGGFLLSGGSVRYFDKVDELITAYGRSMP